MTKEHKDSIAVVSACVMLIFGITLTAIGFAIEPTGDVSDSVLWILGQSLIYAGGIFGIATYTKGVIEKQVNDLENRYLKDNDKQSAEPQEEEA